MQAYELNEDTTRVPLLTVDQFKSRITKYIKSYGKNDTYPVYTDKFKAEYIDKYYEDSADYSLVDTPAKRPVDDRTGVSAPTTTATTAPPVKPSATAAPAPAAVKKRKATSPPAAATPAPTTTPRPAPKGLFEDLKDNIKERLRYYKK